MDNELLAQWLADHDRTEDDVMEDDNGKYIMTEKIEWSEDEEGRDLDYEQGYRKTYLPKELQEIL